MKELQDRQIHIAIVEARFYEDVGEALMEGVESRLKSHNITYDHYNLEGALEIPQAINFLSRNTDRYYDGYLALGCVIRGETTHYETVCNESARGIMDLALRRNLAIANGILTVENKDQAMARADKEEMNKGGSFVEALVSLIKLRGEGDIS